MCSRRPTRVCKSPTTDRLEHLDRKGNRSEPQSLAYIHWKSDERHEHQLIIGVHGYAGPGLEWVCSLATLGSNTASTDFSRWNLTDCPENSAQLLKEANQDLLLGGGYDQLQIFGNSYDVVLVTNLAEPWEFATQADIRTIAAPLSGLGYLNSQCE